MGCNGSVLTASDPTLVPIKKEIFFEQPLFLQRQVENPQEKCKEDEIQHNLEQQSDVKVSHRRTSSITQETLLTVVNRSSINPFSNQYPFDCIGVLQFQIAIRPSSISQNPYQSQEISLFEVIGNGFLISKKLVLTAGHIIDSLQQNRGKQFKFFPNKLTSNRMRDSSVKVISWKRIKLSKNISFEEDFAIVELKEQIQKKRYIPLGFDYNIHNFEGMIAGFRRSADNRDFQQTWMKGDIKEIKPLQIYYDIDTQQGQSGAPLLVEIGKGNYFAIGIHAGNDSQPYNSACKITAEMIKTIKQWSGEINNGTEFVAVKMPSLFTERAELKPIHLPIQIIRYEVFDIFSTPQDSKQQQAKQLNTINEEQEQNQESISAQINVLSNFPIKRQRTIGQKFEQYVKDKTLEQILQLCNYEFRRQMYHQSLILCNYAYKKFSPFQNIMQIILVENLIALNYHNLEQSDIAIGILLKLIDENSQIVSNQAKILLYNNLSSICFDVNKTKHALAFIKEAQRLSQHLSHQKRKQKITILHNIGVLDFSQSNLSQAVSRIDRAITEHQKEFPSQKRELSQMYDVASLIHHSNQNYNLWLKNAFISLGLLKEFYQERLRIEVRKGQKQQKIEFLGEKYPHYSERQDIFVEQIIDLAKNNHLTHDLFMEGLMMIDRILVQNQNKRIRSIWNEGIQIFKKRLF